MERWFLELVSECSIGLWLITSVKRSPPRNDSNYVKTGGVLMPPKWGCGGQEVLRAVSEAIIVSPGSYLTTFIKGSPPRNGSN